MSELHAEPRDFGALSELASELADVFVSVATDIAMVIDDQGRIQRVAFGVSDSVRGITGDWVGRYWADTVTPDTRQKVVQLLADASDKGVSRVRQINHSSQFGQNVSIAYSAVSLGKGGPLLVVGRDLSVVSAMQQRLVSAQQEMERDYWRRRQSEARYQQLFQTAAEATLVVDANSTRIVDANRAATRLIGVSLEQMLGNKLVQCVDAASRVRIEHLMASATIEGVFVEDEADLLDAAGTVRISAIPYHADSSSVLLIRMIPLNGSRQLYNQASRLDSFVAQTPDAIVFTDLQGRVLMANPAFVSLVQAPSSAKVVGSLLSEWLDSLDEIVVGVRSQARVLRCGLRLRAAGTGVVTVDVSAALIADNGNESLGFIMLASLRAHAEPQLELKRPMH